MQADKIKISVKTKFIKEYSDSLSHRYIYAYTITITNQGPQAAQLISRYWKITDSNNQIQEVQGLGVVGQQPRIAPGADYTYTSNAILETETGTMEGYYHMQCDNGETFEAVIPTFTLIPAHAIH